MNKRAEDMRRFWAKLIDEIPLYVRRRASWYLKNVKKLTDFAWLVWSSKGTQYMVELKKGKVVCSCPFFQAKGQPCKHIAAVCVHELILYDFLPWKRKLEDSGLW